MQAGIAILADWIDWTIVDGLKPDGQPEPVALHSVRTVLKVTQSWQLSSDMHAVPSVEAVKSRQHTFPPHAEAEPH